MSGLAHFLEDEGIATTGISLVREHTEGYRPPRFLWVPFPLGRPFGVPGDADFQREVLEAALALLESEHGPVLLADFPRDAPASPAADAADEGWACPVSFPAPPADPNDRGAALLREVEQLAPWHELSVERRGRSTVGLTGLDMPGVASFVAGFLEASPPAPHDDSLSLGENLKLACEDLKAFYAEAAMAQPGAPPPGAVADWFWGETTAGSIFLALQERLASSEEPQMREMAQSYFVPRTQKHRQE